jgi:hypothetical protein
VAGDLERLAYETALRALDKQEGLLEELRARTGILLAASSLAASFLGRDAFQDPGSTTVAILALAAFVVSVAASVYILMPKRALLFSQSGPALYEGLYSVRDDAPEIHRRLAYELYRFWEGNDQRMRNLFRAYRVAAGALVVEILLLVALVSDTLV